MILVIIAMSLFLITSTTIMAQINNQIKSNSKLYNETKYKYEAEAILEKKVATVYSGINSFIERIKNEYNTGTTVGNYKEIKSELIKLESDIIGDKQIKIEFEVIYSKEINYKNEVGKRLKNISSDELKQINIEGIFEDKYKVANTIDFEIDDDFKLTYEVKSYNKGPIK